MRYVTKRTPLPVAWVLWLWLFAPAFATVTSYASTESHRNGLSRKLSGIWLFNAALSKNGISDLPGNLDSPNRSFLIRAADLWTYVESEPIVAELLEASELLQILGLGKEITMNAVASPDVVFTRTVYTDGRSSEQSFGFGNLVISRARWDDDTLIIETQTTGALYVTETYELSADTSLLTISVWIENFWWDQPILLQRVYDRVRIADISEDSGLLLSVNEAD
jgi:hypothetical protein